MPQSSEVRATEVRADEPVLATFRFGPSFRMFATLWWLMGPIPLVLFSVSVMRGGDPINLFIFSFLAAVPIPIWGAMLWRSRIEVTEHFVVIRRLRSPLYFDRATTTINIRHRRGHTFASITDRHGTRESSSISALRRRAHRLRELAIYVPVALFGKPVEPLTPPKS